MSKALSLVTQTACLRKFSRKEFQVLNLCPLIADDTVGDLIVPRKRLENGLASIRMLMSVETRDL